MPNRKNMVIFCGAGFSAPFGIPTMDKFVSQLRDSQILSPDELYDFDRIQLTCDSLGALIGSSSRNLEQLSSFLSVMDITRPDFVFTDCKQYRTPKEAISLVKRCIWHTVRPTMPSKELKSVDQKFRALLQHFNISFVTTNYDLVIELAGIQENCQGWVRPTEMVRNHCFKAAQRPDRPVTWLYATSEQMPAIFKLHGSSNWYQNGPDFRVVDKTATTYETAPDGLARAWGVQVDFGNPPHHQDAIIVPPSVIKPQLSSILEEQWQGACDAISNADVLWFIGYSFPQSDSFMRYFLASALLGNVKIRKLVVMTPDIAVRKRCLSIFRSPRLRDAFVFLPVRWDNIRLDVMAGDDPAGAIRGHFEVDRHDESQRLREIYYAPPDSVE